MLYCVLGISGSLVRQGNVKTFLKASGNFNPSTKIGNNEDLAGLKSASRIMDGAAELVELLNNNNLVNNYRDKNE